MAKDKEKVPPPICLQYKSGDLIIKEGDYGISIYKIIDGKVRISTQSGNTEVNLATLGPGEFIGEMTFLTGSTEPRSASARALEDCELEVWHPTRLSKEYEEMPPILKYIANQALKRLMRMNKAIGELIAKRAEIKGLAQKDLQASQRLFYRKEWDHECVYRPVGGSAKLRLLGRIKDISMSGIGLEVNATNRLNFSHQPGDEFFISTVLPNRKELDVTAKIVSIKSARTPGRLSMGMSFTDMTDEARKRLGFFLMP